MVIKLNNLTYLQNLNVFIYIFVSYNYMCVDVQKA